MVERHALVRPSTSVELEWKQITFCLSDETEDGHPLWKGVPDSLTWDCKAHPSVTGNGWVVDILGDVQFQPTTEFMSFYGDITLSNLKIIFPNEPSNDEAIEGLQNILMELA